VTDPDTVMFPDPVVFSDKARQAWAIIRSIYTDDDRRAEVAEAVGMSFMRAKAVLRIANRPSTLRELAAYLATDAPYVTIVVRDLEERGLVTRDANPTDGRSKLVKITVEGQRTAVRAEAILSRPAKGVAELSESELALLLEILQRAVAAAGPPQKQK
jgi:DNA-binding MarR family transcriptional regulator